MFQDDIKLAICTSPVCRFTYKLPSVAMKMMELRIKFLLLNIVTDL